VPALRTYRLFISHAWHRSEHYSRVVEWLNSTRLFRWENLSVPEHRPVPGRNLEYGLRAQMRPADAFLILGGMYAAHSGWIDFELSFARRIGRPILGIRPWGAQRLPQTIQHAATEIVNWNRESIVDAVRRNTLPTGA
jgi:MTH538 TIR-like domain (DUF1863)